MNVLVRQYTGRTITIKIGPENTTMDLFIDIFEKRENKKITIENWFRSISLLYTCKTIDITRDIKQLGLVEGCTIHEIPKSFTMSPGFDWDTLSILDPISQEDCKEPYSLNPGCNHAFEKNEIMSWIKTCLKDNKNVLCPTCRFPISSCHFGDK